MLADEIKSRIIDSSSFTLIVMVILVIYFIVKVSSDRKKFVRSLEPIPYPEAYPIIGNAKQLNCNLEDFFNKLIAWAKEYQRTYLLWVGPRPFIFIFRYESVQTLLGSSHHIDKSLEYDYFKSWLGDGLITSSGSKWHTRRKLVTPTFHGDLLRIYYEKSVVESQVFVNCLRLEVNKQEFDIVPYAKRAALDTICACAMNYKLNSQLDYKSDYCTAVQRVTAIIQMRFTSVFLKPYLFFKLSPQGREHDRCLRVISRFVDGVIAQKKVDWMNKSINNSINPSKSKNKPQSLLDLLFESVYNGKKLTDKQLREEVNTFMFAGHDTVGTSVSWMLYCLGRYPEYQEKIVDEINDLVGPHGELEYESYNELHWLEACMKETWRMYPVTPLIARSINSPIILESQKIPAGSTVLVNSYLLHRDPRVFPEPDKFKPERFLPDAEKPPLFSFIPFSAGSRNCLGNKFAINEVKVTLAALLRAYKFKALYSEDQLHLVSKIVLDNVGGIRLSITTREPSLSR